jgi:hypothetical protein
MVVTQTFNGADTAATARLRLIKLIPNCGPGPSVGNPGAVGPALNNPELPCSNPDNRVFGNFPATGSGGMSCAGITFNLSALNADGSIDLTPTAPVNLRNAESCEISFTFDVLALPSKDTFPNAAGLHTTSVSSVRSEIVSNPGNPAGVGLQAAGLGSGDAILVNSPPDCTTDPALPGCTSVENCSTKPSAAGCERSTSKPPRMKLAAKCRNRRIRASVTGTGISKVTYVLDGRVLGVVKGGSPFKLNARARNLSRGPHKLSASVEFADKTTPTRVATKRLAACTRAAADPNFTG